MWTRLAYGFPLRNIRFNGDCKHVITLITKQELTSEDDPIKPVDEQIAQQDLSYHLFSQSPDMQCSAD